MQSWRHSRLSAASDLRSDNPGSGTLPLPPHPVNPYTDSINQTNDMSNNPYIAHLQEKGYTEREIRQDATPAPREVPAWYLERYPDATYDSYQDALHDYLNGM